MSRRQKDLLRPLSDAERLSLSRLSRSQSAPAAQVARARAVLAVADGQSYAMAAELVGRATGDTVARWVAAFNRDGPVAVKPRHGGGHHPERGAALVHGGQGPLPLLHRQADRPQGERVVRPPRLTLAGTAALLLGTAATALAAPVSLVAPEGKPAAIVDLRTEDGVRLVGAAWRYADAHLVEAAARAAGPDMRPSGPEVRATDIEPKAGPADYQDASWDEVPAA